MNKIINVAEGRLRDCSECIFSQTDPRLRENCERGLWVSWGVATCNSQDEQAGMTQVREGASIQSAGNVGVMITYDHEGLLLKGQYRVHPSHLQRMLARVGIHESMWHPEDI